jgi:transitional endoplasmic reticulum ATPase
MPNADELFSALRAALAVDPGNLPLRLHLAGLLREHGRPSEAQAEYRVARDQLQASIAEQPDNANLYEHLARVQQALGDEWAAQTSLGIATALRGTRGASSPPPAKAADTPAPRPAPPPDPLPRAAKLPAGDADDPFDPEPGLAERPGITFADVGGLADLKERIRLAIIYPFQRPEVYAAYGKQAGGGLLLYGPPGCGKTYIARATAGEVGAQFISIGISDVLDMWYGESEKKLHAIFATARRVRPTVLFFDEIEALGGNRLDMRQHHQRTLVNQFLAELDGAEGDNRNVLIVGATNSPWHVDPALRRPGRFDKIVFVAPPDEEARREIVRLHLAGKPAAEDVDVARLARETEGYSGADLRGVVEAATEAAVQAALRTGRIAPLTTAGLLRALRSQRPSTLEWLSTAKNYAIYSNEGGVYDEVAAYLRQRKMMR